MLALKLAFRGNLFQMDENCFMYIDTIIISTKTGFFQFRGGHHYMTLPKAPEGHKTALMGMHEMGAKDTTDYEHQECSSSAQTW